ncbi:MAG TPA: hypothetical protein VGW38_16520, partial [Chloroflexota bacterium]|nr:hypothetical protein [Chloroflexota bacterium]
ATVPAYSTVVGSGSIWNSGDDRNPEQCRCDAASMALQILQRWGEAARAISRPQAVAARWERGGYA